ncbi:MULTISPECIES: pirin family protein [Gammaproteobacteria]|uniref:pirin family protein n=1 Tax=Gammaproteobacteria TaxID=1236 RepID=UPI000DCFC27F|nr:MULTISPECIES: pirin family protein [Gammaproteobacteria]RTE87016.1 pirin family protein [Aliidiomarina sp. B3213]TCZ93194.1 pirin family protein [Lysobacter sp. N42]
MSNSNVPASTQSLSSKSQQLTDEIEVFRIIPQKQRRTVGPFCFVDHFGPTPPSTHLTFDVAPHPHIGLQTLSYLWQGQILHLDSLGSKQWLKPGQCNLMTAGKGISHAEVIPEEDAKKMELHGVQLWLALPPEQMNTAPDFVHVSELPKVEVGSYQGLVILGALEKLEVPVEVKSPCVAFDLKSEEQDAKGTIQLETEFEYLVYVVASKNDNILINGVATAAHNGVYLATNTDKLEIAGAGHVLVLGGTPYPENLRMFWNFVATSNEDLYDAANRWNEGDSIFGTVKDYPKYGKGPERLMSPEPPLSFKKP